MTDYTEPVSLGADALTEYFGNDTWREEINPYTLRIDCVWSCVLAQVFGSYSEGCNELGLTTMSQEVSHGFYPVPGVDNPDELTDAWLIELGH
jgi:hypothetical protein